MKKYTFILILLCLSGTVFSQNKPYKGAELYSFEGVSYGKFEFRMSVAKGSGILSTFFLYKQGSEVNGTFWEEIDVEVFGKDNAETWQSNIITGTDPLIFSEEEHHTATDLSNSYHTYTVEWRPNSVIWKFDGQTVRTTTGAQANSLINTQSVRFNLWSSTAESWVGPFDDSELPVHQYVNWIRYYQWNGSDFDATPTWIDDFQENTLNSRWGKATWTFDGNRVDFAPDNLNLVDGYLVLSLTKQGEEGYTGTPPIDPDGQILSISDFNGITEKLTIYPSPIVDLLTIEAPIGTSLKVIDINCKTILDNFIMKNKKEVLSVLNWNTGIYFLEASFNASKIQKKLVKY